MRIAYIVHYQGPGLVKNRPCLHNLSLGNKVKLEAIARLLRQDRHEVEMISQGEVDRKELRFYPFFEETDRFDSSIPIYYASAIPVRFVNGFWSSYRTVQLLKARHRVSPFDVVIIHTTKRPQLACARFASRRLGLPVILEYEDDCFVDGLGREARGWIANYHRLEYRRLLKNLSGCMAVSPYLLSQLPESTPKFLLRGIVHDAIVNGNQQPVSSRRNWVVFSGTHEENQGLEQMVEAWLKLGLGDWELHIAGRGPLTPKLQKLAGNNGQITFHGFLTPEQNAQLLCAAKIGMNPQEPTRTPGTSFAFKIIEYLAAGLHVITTPRGAVEAGLEAGITYINDNSSKTIAACLEKTIDSRSYHRTAQNAAVQAYGPRTVAAELNRLLDQATGLPRRRFA